MDFHTGHRLAALPRERKKQCLSEVCEALASIRAPSWGWGRGVAGEWSIREKTVKLIGHSRDFFLLLSVLHTWSRWKPANLLELPFRTLTFLSPTLCCIPEWAECTAACWKMSVDNDPWGTQAMKEPKPGGGVWHFSEWLFPKIA